MVLVFAQTKSLFGAMAALVFFSLFVQTAEGSTYGIVPYVDAQGIGAVTGLVGAGGSAGGVLFSLFFREMAYAPSFRIMGALTILSSLASVFLSFDTSENAQVPMENMEDDSKAGSSHRADSSV